jgi:hypothetical protein
LVDRVKGVFKEFCGEVFLVLKVRLVDEMECLIGYSKDFFVG